MNLRGLVSEQDVGAIIGELLSDAGTSRKVFTVKDSEDWVVKEALSPPHSANLREWEVWDEVRNGGFSHLFAECRAMSVNGRYLVMERLNPDIGLAPKPALPIWMKDRKSSGLGIEPPRDCRRPFGLSYAAMGTSSSMA